MSIHTPFPILWTPVGGHTFSLAHPVAHLTNFQFTPHPKGRSMIDLLLFTGCFTAFLMVLRNFTLNRITYNTAMLPTFLRR